MAGEGYNIEEAANGEEALKIALATSIDLVITDLKMPKMNGWRLLSMLRRRDLDIPVIIMTGYVPEEGQKLLTSKEIVGFVTKPIDFQTLSQMVNNVFSPQSPGRKLRVLAIDDTGDTLLLISKHLQQAGFEIKIAQNGHDALKEVDRFKPDLLLLDLVMPQMDGFEVCRHLRSQPASARLPIILLTAKTSGEDVKKSRGPEGRWLYRQTIQSRSPHNPHTQSAAGCGQALVRLWTALLQPKRKHTTQTDKLTTRSPGPKAPIRTPFIAKI